MTSNLGARRITERKSLGFATADENADKDYAQIKNEVMNEVKQAFRPEFLNRVDEIMVFHQLSSEDIKEIAVKMLEGLTKRLKENGISVEFTDDAIAKIAAEGFDPVYGARPIRRVIQNGIEDMIAEKMLASKIKEGDSIKITATENGFDAE